MLTVGSRLLRGPTAGTTATTRVGDVEGRPGERRIAVPHGKGDKHRAVPVDPRLDDLLTTYLADRWRRFPSNRQTSSPSADPWAAAPPRVALFAGSNGEPLTVGQLSYLVTKAYRTVGINSHRPPGALIHRSGIPSPRASSRMACQLSNSWEVIPVCKRRSAMWPPGRTPPQISCDSQPGLLPTVKPRPSAWRTP